MAAVRIVSNGLLVCLVAAAGPRGWQMVVLHIGAAATPR
jgi:hypothetical protein